MNTRGMTLAAAAALALGLAAGAPAQEVAMTQEEAERTTEFMLYTQWMDAFRVCGMETPENLLKRFFWPGQSAEREWKGIFGESVKVVKGTVTNHVFVGNFLPETQADFIRGAIPLAGPFSGERMVMGLYNPHWNAIMLFEVEGELPKTEEEADKKLPKATKMRFMSGEAFCGEHPEEPDFSTVLPGGAGRGAFPDEPLSPGLWRAQAKVMRRFNELYPARADDDPRLKESALGEIDTGRDMEMLIARVAVRLKGLEGMHLTPEWRAVAGRVERVLQLGLRSQMKRYFENPLHDTFVETFSKLPRSLKLGFRAYGCVANEEGTLYLFVNQDFPRLYATVSVPKGRLENPDAGTVDFEWYDLDQAEELLKVWEGRPGAKP